ncbi:Vacuolar membrane protease [Frankliniella fusca]|uniref:Vacuolar membrane protease n=1 Tax=Frankliniella fusca TaxID=407009 RepID=A0AAE1H6I5_9NEOP|nr:Vacuolar membrane protease [Frankliniella fusca]
MKVLSAYLEMGFVDAKKNTIECAIDSNSKKYIRSFTLVLRYENIYGSMFHHREDEKLNVTDRCALSDCELQIVFWKLRSELSECLEERRLRCHGKRYGDKQHSGYECCAIRFEGHFLLFFSHIMSMAIFFYVKCELFPQDLQICT